MSRLTDRRLFQLPWRTARRIRADVDAEIRFDLDMRTAELVEQGIPEADARRQALAEFGNLEQTRDYCASLDDAGQRAEGRAEWLAEAAQDARVLWRGMLRARCFALVVLVTIALGIGANTAVFSVVRTVLLERLPYRQPDQLVRLYGTSPGNPDARGMLTPVEIGAMQQSPALSGVGVWGWFSGVTYVGDRSTEAWQSVQVSPDFFRVLGVRAWLGRTIDARDVGADAVPAVILTYSVWQQAFGGDSTVVGREIRLSGHNITVVGILPPNFVSPDRAPEVWLPLDLRTLYRDPVAAEHQRAYRAVGRLASGVRREALATALDVAAHRIRDAHPALENEAPVAAVPLHDDMVAEVRPALLAVMGAAALVLALACLNLAGFFLSRALARQRELATRAALGAGRGRLVRQLLAESAILALAGGALGVAFAFWVKPALFGAGRVMMPSMGAAHIDLAVLAFAFAISVASALAFGLMPALVGTRFNLQGSLAAVSRTASGGLTVRHMGRLLVAVQVALAVVLLIGAGLLARTLAALERTGVGYDTSARVLTFAVALTPAQYADPARQTTFFHEFLTRVSALHGVRAAGTVVVAPWLGYTAGGPDSLVTEDGTDIARGTGMASRVTVSPGYFTALSIPLRRGRGFTPLDRADAPFVAIINESMARTLWPGTNPLGRRIRSGSQRAPWMQIVGVVGDVRPFPWAEPPATVYVSSLQQPQGWGTVVVRSDGDPRALVPQIRGVLHDIDPTLPIPSAGVETMDEMFAKMLARQRLPMFFSGAFAVLALVLAALGVYSIMAYSVTARQKEFGIRTALGARQSNVLALVVRQGMTMAIIGAVAGLLVAGASTRLLSGLLIGVTPHDPATFAVVPLVLLAVSGVACFVPARRAMSVDPLEALRAE
jgi:predicted permease